MHGRRQGLRILLTVMGVVMIVAGSGTVLLGAASLPGEDQVPAVIDSEMRFYAIWYVAAGLILLRCARDVEGQTWLIRLVAFAFFASGCSRALSWLVIDAPHWTQIVLMIIELVLPFVVIPWQAAVARHSHVTS